MNISPSDFTRLVTFIRSKYGINLEKKQHLIQARLSDVIIADGFTSFSDYTNHIITHQNEKDIETMLNVLTTNYTYFMRETAHFDYFRDTILPWLEQTKKNKVLSIWSAGCALGQEPYTLSMILKDHFRNKPGWDTRILATDISIKALNQASRGIYSEETIATLPSTWKNHYFTKVHGSDEYSVNAELKSNVIFRHFNLMDPISFKLKFDVIFCRNVMIYFDKETRDDLTARYFNATAPGGYLFVGHSEGFTTSNNGYQYVMPAAYRKPIQ